jgi:tetratricopeptide (TPR) repeat protein
MKCPSLVALLFVSSAIAQPGTGATYKLALPDRNGQLRWSGEGFQIEQSSAKPGGQEIGLRGRDQSGRLSFLGFLFRVPNAAPLTAGKCRDSALEVDKKSNSGMKLLNTAEFARPGQLPVSLVTYEYKGSDGTHYAVRGFVASGDVCGDLAFYSSKPIGPDDADLKAIFSTYELDMSYTPRFADVSLYAQLLYNEQSFKAAGPVFEKALTMIPADGAPFPSASAARRVLTDNAGMAYGISGDLKKARAIFEKAIAEDPEYPLYYYNLACADAEEKKLADARRHLQEAFARKGNVIAGESLPDPTKDDSFLPYQSNKEFWAFLKSLR